MESRVHEIPARRGGWFVLAVTVSPVFAQSSPFPRASAVLAHEGHEAGLPALPGSSPAQGTCVGTARLRGVWAQLCLSPQSR